MKRIILAFTMSMMASFSLLAQNVTFNDTNLKNALLADATINTTDDGEISVAEATAYTGNLVLSGLSISDATGIEAFVNINLLNLSSNDLTSLDVSALVDMVNLDVGQNSLTSITLPSSTSLKILYVDNNDLTSVDLSNLPELTTFQAQQNDLGSLDVSSNPDLSDLRITNASLTSLDLSSNTKLGYLYLIGTDIVELDLSNNDMLTTVSATANSSLTTVDLRNGNNDAITIFAMTSSPSLTCVLVDSPSESKANWTSIDDNSVFTFRCDINDIVDIPDANLKSILLADGSINTTDDGEITYLEAEAYTDNLIIENEALTSSKGLEAFINIPRLEVDNAGLNEIALSDYGSLTVLSLHDNNLTEIDVSYLSGLTYLLLYNNSLTSLDITNNPDVNYVGANYNDISSFTFTGNELQTLSLSGNDLSSLDVSGLDQLFLLHLSDNNLSSIDVSNSVDLQHIKLNNNPISSIDISNNLELKSVDFSYTDITSLDLSDHPDLTSLNVNFCDLSSLDLRNGATESLSTFAAVNNASLTCIAISDPIYAASTFPASAPGATFSLSCDPNETIDFPDANFKAILVANGSINTTPDGEITVGEAQTYSGTISGANGSISDITGIEYFENLTQLTLGGNSITQVDLRYNVDLTTINLLYNDLTSIDLSYNTLLSYANLAGNNLTSIDISNNPDLLQLFLGENALTSIDVSNNIELINLGLQDNTDISSLDITMLTDLQLLYADRTSISTLDLSNNNKIKNLRIYDTNLSTINLSNLVDLEVLKANNIGLTTIDVTNNVSLTTLEIANSPITNIDLSNNPSLELLYVQGTQLTSLDITNNTNLEIFLAFNTGLYDMPLQTVNMATGANETISTISLNPLNDLSCVIVDNPTYSEANWTNIGDPSVYKLTCNPDDIVNIPDANFKAELLANTEINTTDDGEITYGEAEAFTGTLDVNNSGINDATGLEAFMNIIQLNMRDNNLTSIDVTNNPDLTYLNVRNNSLTEIDVSYNTELTSLELEINDLTELDVSNNPLLRYLHLQSNELSALDLSNNDELRLLRIHHNDFVSFSASNPLLQEILLNGNPLTSIDVTNLPSLTRISLQDVLISSIDLSNNPVLTNIDVANNDNLTSLDLSNNPLMNTVIVWKSDNLASLNVKNGSNQIITSWNSTQTPNLTCISVDDPIYSEENWTNVDAANEFVLSCDPNEAIDFPDANFKSALLSIGSLNTVDDGEITVSEAEAYTGDIVVIALDIADLTGIEYFPNIDYLNVGQNELTSINVAYNTALTSLRIGANDITSLDVSRNTMLDDLIISENPISDIDISNNTLLNVFSASDNLITTIDLSQNTLITNLSIFDQPNLESLDVSPATQATNLFLRGNNLSSIDISSNVEVKYLDLQNNNLSSVDLSNNPDLLSVEIYNNQLSSLDLSSNALLNEFDASDNMLTELNIANGNNAAITAFDVTGNTNLTCITVDDVDYSDTNWTNIDDVANFSTDCDNTSTEITAFSFAEEIGAATIDAGEQSVTIEVALGSDFTTLTPTFTVSTGATASPESGVAQDFTNGFTYTITAENPTVSEDWTITVLEENTTPTDITLSESAIDENNAENDVVGELSTTDENIGDTYTYSLVAGDGDTDNASFSISGNNLLAIDILDFETKDAYSIRLETNDNRGGTFEKAFAISVNDANDAPSAIEITNTSVDENETPNVLIGDLSSTDQDSGDTHTYSLVSGTGDDDNASFTIESNSLLAIESFDFEAQSSYSVLVRSTDSEGGEFDQAFTIDVHNVNEGIEVISAIADQSKQVGFASFEIDLSDVFEDIDGDDLTFDAESVDEDVVTVAVSGSMLTITEVGLGDATITVSANDGLGETAEDSFVLSVKEVLSTETEITAFSLSSQTGSADIDAENATISIEVEAGTDVTALEPTISISESASISPTGAQDFSSDFVYTVTAEDGETIEDWTVTVTVAPFTGTDILTFSLDEAIGLASIDETAHTVEIEVAFGTDVSSLVPTITVSEGATISPSSSSEVDFTNTVEFTVTAEDESTQVWTVSVEEAPNDANDILSFVLADQTGDATIDTENHTIAIEVTFGTDLTALEPSIAVSENATLDLSGSQDFTSIVIYTVTSESGVAQEWEVNVTDALNDENDILSFSLESTDGTIDASAHTVAIELPFGTDITALTPEIEVSENATITPDGAQDFSAAVEYTVTSESGDPQEWSVSVSVLENTANDIVAFDLSNLVGDAVIDDVNHTVEAAVEFGTDLTALEPTIEISEAATVDLSGPQDFSSDVTYTITSESGDAQQWVVSVRNVANDQVEILSFEITGQVSSSIDIANKLIDVIMPAGTDVTALSASITISENATISPDPTGVVDYSSKVVFSVTAENGNVKDWTVRVEVEATVLSTNQLVEVALYPNPFMDVVKIDGLNEMVTINIIDMHGKMIHEETIERESVSIDLSRFDSGTYLISVQDQNKNIIYSNRLIKSN